MMTISVIVGGIRQGRFSEKPAQWILQQLHKREGIEARLLDLRDFPMPFFDQPMPPAIPGRPVRSQNIQLVAIASWPGRFKQLYSSRSDDGDLRAERLT